MKADDEIRAGGRMTPQYVETYRLMVTDCCKDLSRSRNQQQVTAFWPIQGEDYEPHRLLMVVGRAVNGWLDEPFDLSMAGCQGQASDLASLARDASLGDDPLSWVEQPTESYNPHRSQFWSTIKKVVLCLSPDAMPWYNAIVWTNLYKIAPDKGGNPGTILSRVQLPCAKELLREEIEHFRPSRVLFLTGFEMARDFFPDCSIVQSTGPKRDMIEATGRVFDTDSVVVPHPQGRSPEKLSCAIAEEFHAA